MSHSYRASRTHKRKVYLENSEKRCGSKIKHRDLDTAWEQIDLLRESGQSDETATRVLSVYKCGKCGGYHVGHQSV